MLLPATTLALEHHLAVAQSKGRSPSMVAAVARDVGLVWSSAIESTADTQYRIGSLTKTFVAVLVMRLRDEGRIALEDPVGKHLPGALDGAITVRQLLAHTSGLASETPAPWWERTPGSTRPTLAKVLGEHPMVHAAGRRFHYSNPGYATLGALVGKLRGKSWAVALRDEILQPLEMLRTSLRPKAPHADGFAVHPWADVAMPEVVEDTGLMAPAGQLWSTVEDLCRFASLLSGGVPEVLSAAAAEEMREVQSAPTAESWETGYGLGLQVLRTAGRTLVGHTGSMPGFLCALWICPEERVGAVALANTTSGVPIGEVGAELLGIVADREPQSPEPWKPMAGVDSRVLELTGVWYWGPQAIAFRLCSDGALELVRVRDGVGRKAKFEPKGDGCFIGRNGYFHGETLRPVRGADGALRHLDIGSFVFTRQPYEADADIPGGVDPAGWGAR